MWAMLLPECAYLFIEIVIFWYNSIPKDQNKDFKNRLSAENVTFALWFQREDANEWPSNKSW